MRFKTTAPLAACIAALLYVSAPAASALQVAAPGNVAKSAQSGAAVEAVRYRSFGRGYGHRRYRGYGYGYGYRRHYRPYYYSPYAFYGGGYGYGYPYYYRRRPGISLYFGF